MAVPQSGTTGRWLVSHDRSQTWASWAGRFAGPASTSAVAKTLTASPRSVRRVRCSPAVYAATPIRRRRPLPRRRARPSRQREIALCSSPVRFRHASNPTRHPPRGPPKIRQCRSQRRAANVSKRSSRMRAAIASLRRRPDPEFCQLAARNREDSLDWSGDQELAQAVGLGVEVERAAPRPRLRAVISFGVSLRRRPGTADASPTATSCTSSRISIANG